MMLTYTRMPAYRHINYICEITPPMLKKIPPVNIVLFALMLVIVTAAIIGVMKVVKSSNPTNNYVEASYNAALSKHYTDSLARTPLAELGKITIAIYDSIEDIHKSFVLCKIKNNQETFPYYEVQKRSVTSLLTLFPHESWYGEISYSISDANGWKSSTFNLPYTLPESFGNRESIWDE